MSADQFELNCSVREDKGKGASRRLRRLDNQIPAILYGGKEEPMSLSIAHDDIFHATENEAFFSHIITLNIGKKKRRRLSKRFSVTLPSHSSCTRTSCASMRSRRLP